LKDSSVVFEYGSFLDLKNYSEIDKNVKIIQIRSHLIKPYLFYISTTHGIYVIQINVLGGPNICFEPSFVSSLGI
jgi:hypothetical protein